MTDRQQLQLLLAETRQTILSAPDSVCLERAQLVTEAWKTYAEAPVPVRRARAFAHVLRNMTLDLQTNPILAGNTSTGPRAWMLVPEHGFTIPAQAVVENPSLDGFLDGDTIPSAMRAFWEQRSSGGAAGIGHLAIDAEKLLSRGLTGILDDAHSQPTSADAEEAGYLEATTIACEAVMAWAQRFADAAEAVSQAADAPRRQALRRVAAACRRVPAQPAGSFFDALQSLTLVHLAIHIEGHGYSVSPGRLDQALAPHYRGEEDAVELLAAFLLKVSANSLWGSHSKTQTITLGGVDAQGRDQCNDLTLAVLEAWEQVPVPDPMVFVRWHAGISSEVKRRAVTMLSQGHSMPLLIGDSATAAGLTAAGVDPDDAWNYCVVGCNELGIPGKLIYNAVPLAEAGLLRDAVVEDGGLRTFDDLMDRLEELAADRLRPALKRKRDSCLDGAQQTPTPFTSALMACGRPGRGDLLTELPYPFICIRSSGFANLVNGLYAVRQLVFDDGGVSLPQLAEALQENFVGHGPLRVRLQALCRWGDEDPGVGNLAENWLERRRRTLEALRKELGTPPLLMEMVVRSLNHVEGSRLGATPDGRGAGELLGDSVGPPGGTSPGGPTAVLNTVRAMDAPRHWPGGYNLNLTLPSMAGANEEGRSRLVSLIEAYFATGGQELQLNFLDADTLCVAREHPERYPDLMVRIAGFNAFFVELSPVQQAEIIARATASTGARVPPPGGESAA